MDGLKDNMTLEDVASLVGGCGRMGDTGHPARPWVYFTHRDRLPVEGAYKALGRVGGVDGPERGKMRVWKFYSHGNDALVALYDLPPYLQDQTKEQAERLLERWGNNGAPWETERQRRYETKVPERADRGRAGCRVA